MTITATRYRVACDAVRYCDYVAEFPSSSMLEAMRCARDEGWKIMPPDVLSKASVCACPLHAHVFDELVRELMEEGALDATVRAEARSW